MPILDVECIGPVPEAIRRGLPERIAEAAATVLGSGPHNTWVKLRYVAAEEYAENAGGPPAGAQPVMVRLLLADLPGEVARAEQAAQLTLAIAAACDRPAENVHLLYEPPARGRIAFGGKLRT